MAGTLKVDTLQAEAAAAVTIADALVIDETLVVTGAATLNTLASSGATITGGTITGITDLVVADGGTGVSTLADGGIIVGAGTGPVEVVAAGATTEILVGGGAGTNPVWTTATGSGAPVRATSPTLVTPLLGTPTSGNLANCTGYPEAALTTIDAKGDLLVGTADNTAARLAVGSAGTIPMSESVASTGLKYVAALNKVIYGLTYANNSGDATNDIDIATGGAMDATGAYWMTLASALTKQSDAAWAVGTNAGGLDTGAVGNSDYYIWLIARSDTGVVDVLFSLSSTAPTMPTNYDFKRLIGWFRRSGGAILGFKTYEQAGGGLEFLWNSPTLDINLAATLTSSEREDALAVPLNFSVVAQVNIFLVDASVNQAYIHCPDTDDLAPSTTVAPLATALRVVVAGSGNYGTLTIRTSATGTIAARATGLMDTYQVVTLGFSWSRR